MSCKLVRRHLGAFVDGELEPATQIEFERHLEGVLESQRKVDEVKKVLKTASDARNGLRMKLRNIAEYLDNQADGDSDDTWINKAIEQGALEE